MAFTQEAISTIKSLVQEAKKLLMTEFDSQLQQYYGIRPDGSCTFVEELTSTSGSVIQTAQLLRERIDYLKESIPGNNKDEEAVAQLKREQAFTILNRFAALRLAEERGIVRESVRKGYQSEGFQVFDQLTGGAQSADQFSRYTSYLNAVFDELALDLPSVFDRFSPYALLFPSEKALNELLDILNEESLSHFREPGRQPINLWKEDETIGWIYQYYNSREEISAMREASGAPRNSRELAVRNQFFTPRYVVQFLVDNSLGRQWYEMNQGNTELAHQCTYLVKHEQEIFLGKGEDLPSTRIEGAHYVEHRPLKDPREILMLDPACGSMHFGLYCFDLFENIYTEAWDKHIELMPDLRDRYSRQEFIRQIPEMIIRHNIHGVDIDPRAIQIAGLSLWLRAQKSYANLGLEPKDRPSISKSNLVVAEPMPGDINLLSEFTQSLPGPIGKLVRVIWEKMKLAGETGLLLKIEQELKKEIEIAKKEWEEYKDTSTQTRLFDSPEDSKESKMAAVYGKGQKLSKDFFDRAEEQVLKALKSFAVNAEGEHAFQKLLFAEDTARGFSFIELCRKKYDVIVMNPPFGSPTLNSKDHLKKDYSNSWQDIFTAFVTRMSELKMFKGHIGCISNRTAFFITTFKKWRTELFQKNDLRFFIDLGSGVLDAMVETAAYIISKKDYNKTGFINLIESNSKSIGLLSSLQDNKIKWIKLDVFKKLPNFSISHWITRLQIEYFSDLKPLKTFENTSVVSGLTTGDDFRFLRLWWETPSKYFVNIAKGGPYATYIGNFKLKVNWRDGGKEIKATRNSYVRNEDYYFKPGITWSRRTSSEFSARLLPKNFIFADKGPAIFTDKIFRILSLAQSKSFKSLINIQLAAGDQAARSYEVGIIKNTPIPDQLPNSDLTVSEIISIVVELLTFDETSIFFSNELPDYKHLEVFLNQKFKRLDYLDELIQKKVDYSYGQERNDYSCNWGSHVSHLNEEFEAINNRLSLCFGYLFERNKLLRSGKKIVQELLSEFVVDEPCLDAEKDYIAIYSKNSNEFEKSIYKVISEKKHLIQDLESLSKRKVEFNIIDYFKNPNRFFDFHLRKYTDSGRKAPIYLPLSSESGNLVIWCYYPKLNERTIFKILNDSVDPIIDDLRKEIISEEKLGSSSTSYDNRNLLGEIEDFKYSLLRVADLPYRPNLDDGVLITAAPLYNLFQHSKWKKATEICWKKLEKGEYDWSHLAYSIWPERVREKCKKDLSMAIAHGLEDICEIKPRQPKTRTKKGIKEESQKKLM